jgi:transcriptional regulator with XRE-family HTH domain
VVEEQRLFSSELRRRRLGAGLSLGDMAKLANYSKGYLSKIENGHKPPGVDVARRLDAVLGADGQLSRLALRRHRRSGETDGADEGEVWIMILGSDGISQLLPVSRRQALALGLSSALGIGLVPRSGGDADDGRALVGFRQIFDETRQLARVTSPRIVLPSIVAQTQAVRGLAAGRDGALRRDLLLLAARSAELAGWMAQESGNDRAARRWTTIAVDISSAAGDRELAGYALLRQADLTLHRDEAEETIALARRAQEELGSNSRLVGLAAQREAQGHALLGDHDACRRALDRAESMLGLPGTPTGDRGLGSSSVPNLGELVTGWCLVDLGRPAEAAEVLDRAVASIPPSALRARARFGTRRALAHAAAGDLDIACAVTASVLRDAGSVDSATVRLDLRRLARTLARWQHEPMVKRLQPQLAVALRSTDT